jgi:GT2 family glycosyltransferase
MTAPDVSVVIPSSRGARLAFALEALSGQTLHAARFEVIVVRDAAAPPVTTDHAKNVRVIHAQQSTNIAALRNLGWRAAAAPLIAFTDDDCRPSSEWLAQLIEVAGDPRTMVQGRTEPDPDEVHLLHGLARSQELIGPSPFYQTCNLLYPRTLLERHDGFDERFGSLGEDCDMAMRARASGAGVIYVDDAVVWHGVISRTLPVAVRETARRDTMPALVARHPELRQALYGRYFWKRSHALLLLAAAGLLGFRRRAALGLLALPYLQGTLDPQRASGPRNYVRRALHLPSRILVDACELAVTARAAVRERTLLL